jgi:ankyrin repeat protein
MSLEIKDAEGRTPMHVAMADGTPEAIDAFLQAGADLHAKDRSGTTPMDVLKAKGQADKDALLQRALRHCSSALMRLLMEGGASADAPIHLETSFLLHMLTGTADSEPYPAEQIARLLQAGADPQVKDVNGLNALHYAIRFESAHGAPELAEAYLQCLLREGLNPNAGDKQGMTPLHLAVLDGRTDLVGTLLRAGADIQARDARGETPLAVAQDFGHADIVALMQKGPGEAKALPDPGEKKTMAPTP